MIKILGSIQNLFKSKAFVIILSVIIAVISWIYVMDSSNPNVEESITVTLSYLNENVPGDSNLTKVGSTGDVSVKVKVSGRSELISRLSASDFTVTADYGSINEAGTYELEINEPTCKKTGIKVKDYSPKTISVTYDKQIEKSVAIEIPDAEKYLADGYEIVSVTTEPVSIPFSGLSGDIEDLDHIEIDLSTQITTIDENKHLTYIAKFISDTGDDISSKFDSEKIKVNIYVAKRVPITYEVTGKPGTDCYLDSVTISEKDVLVSVTDDLYAKELKKLESIDLGTVDASGKLTAFDVKYDITDYIGEHFELADSSESEVLLSVLISQKEVRTFKILKSNIKVEGKNDDLDYETDYSPLKITSDQKFGIKLKAKPADFDDFDETSIEISVSYPQEACEKQIHNLVIKLPDNIELEGEYYVYITATEKQIEIPEETTEPDVTEAPETTEVPEATNAPTEQ